MAPSPTAREDFCGRGSAASCWRASSKASRYRSKRASRMQSTPRGSHCTQCDAGADSLAALEFGGTEFPGKRRDPALEVFAVSGRRDRLRLELHLLLEAFLRRMQE